MKIAELVLSTSDEDYEYHLSNVENTSRDMEAHNDWKMEKD